MGRLEIKKMSCEGFVLGGKRLKRKRERDRESI